MGIPLQPEEVEDQFGGFLQLMADDPAKAKEMLDQLRESGLTLTIQDIHDEVVKATQPINDTLDHVRRMVDALVEGLQIFREEVLSRLPTPKPKESV